MAIDIFKQYATDEALEINGSWMDLGGGTRLLIARSGNDRYGKLLAKLFELHRQVLDVGDEVADAKSKDLMIDVMANTILVGWENLVFKGEALEYSVENAKKVLAVKDFRRLVAGFSEQLQNFQTKEEARQGEA